MKQPYTPELVELLAQDFALNYIYKKQEGSWLNKLEKRVVLRAETIFKREYSEEALERKSKMKKNTKKTATKKAPATKKMPVKKKK